MGLKNFKIYYIMYMFGMCLILIRYAFEFYKAYVKAKNSTLLLRRGYEKF